MGTPVERFTDLSVRAVRSHVYAGETRSRSRLVNQLQLPPRARAFLNLHFNFALQEDRWDELLSQLIFGVRTELPLI